VKSKYTFFFGAFQPGSSVEKMALSVSEISDQCNKFFTYVCVKMTQVEKMHFCLEGKKQQKPLCERKAKVGTNLASMFVSFFDNNGFNYG
jgi:hypothetical protein